MIASDTSRGRYPLQLTSPVSKWKLCSLNQGPSSCPVLERYEEDSEGLVKQEFLSGRWNTNYDNQDPLSNQDRLPEWVGFSQIRHRKKLMWVSLFNGKKSVRMYFSVVYFNIMGGRKIKREKKELTSVCINREMTEKKYCPFIHGLLHN